MDKPTVTQRAHKKLAEMGVITDQDPESIIEGLLDLLGDTQRELNDAKIDLADLADIHAANLEIAERSSTSKRERDRLAMIASIAHNTIQGVSGRRHLGKKGVHEVSLRIEDHLAELIHKGKVSKLSPEHRILKPVTGHDLTKTPG